MFVFWYKIYYFIWKLNLKNGWLNNYNCRVYVDFDYIDTLGSEAESGKIISSYHDERCSEYYLDFFFIKITLISV